MEIEIMYPELIADALIVAFVLLLFWRKRKKFKKGVMVANTKFIKKTRMYKFLLVKYHGYNFLIKVVCLLLIFLCAFLTARVYKKEENEEIIYNRDIMLCMDISGSMEELNKSMLTTMADTVSKLKDERFGITVFDSSPVVVLPLTNDYNYALTVLNDVNEALYGSKTTYITQAIRTGARTRPSASLIGDGLAYCASSFKKDDERTKIVILTTDNMPGSGSYVSVPEAASYAKENNVKVYSIGASHISSNSVYSKYRDGLINVASVTGGAYYDYISFSTDDIVRKIEELNKSAVIKNVSVTNHDLPELFFPYLLYLVLALFLLEWRVRI